MESAAADTCLEGSTDNLAVETASKGLCPPRARLESTLERVDCPSSTGGRGKVISEKEYSVLLPPPFVGHFPSSQGATAHPLGSDYLLLSQPFLRVIADHRMRTQG